MSIVSRAGLEKKATAQAKKAAAGAADKAKSYADGLVKKAEGAMGGMQSAVAKLTESKVAGVKISDRLAKVAGSKLAALKNKKLASPFYEQGPKTETLTQDVTGITEALSLINKSGGAGNPLGSLLGPMADLAKGVGKDLKSLATDVLQSAASGISINKDGLKDRVKSLVNSDRLLSGLSQNMQSSLGSMGGISGEISQIVDVTVGGVTGQMGSDKLAAVQGIAGVINQITKNDTISSVMDVGAKASLVSGLMSEAISLKMPNVVGAFTEAFQGDNVVQEALLGNIGNILTNTDQASVATTIKTVGADRIMSVLPQAAAFIAAGCSISTNTKVNEYGRVLEGFMDNLEAVKPDWRTVSFGEEPVGDLTVFTTASDDLYALLTSPMQTDTDLKIDAILGRSVSVEDMSSVIGRSIPNIPGYGYA